MKTACIFPGQGSQSIGMSTALAEVYPVVKDIYKEASEALSFDLWDLVADGSAEQLNQTQHTQPAILTAAYSVWKVLKTEINIQPEFLAGHSLGEYTALVCAESLQFSDAIKLVFDRGQFMQQAVPAGEGAMAAILGLEDAQVIEVCEQSAQSEVVSAVNFNSPGQVVIAGQKAAVERAMAAAKDAGAKRALSLPVSVPSHCALMQTAAEKLKQRLSSIDIQTPVIPVIHNVDVQSHSDPDAIRNALAAQLYSPVRWSDTISSMSESGVTTMLECGPGRVLTGLCKRINKALNNISINNPNGIKTMMDSLSA